MRSLFITYDGLTDPLGRSQILPYLVGLAREHQIYVLSFEKPERYRASGQTVRELVEQAGIVWRPLRFSRGWKMFSKPWDLLKMYLWAFGISWRHQIQLVHCRSYLAAQVAVPIRRLLGARMLFDMRGFWVDERVDNGSWNLKRPKDRLIFHLYKKIESLLFAQADHVISLTEAAVTRVRQCLRGRPIPVTVIPCCADFEHFQLDSELRSIGRKDLNMQADDRLLCYAGTLGGWYQFPEMLEVFGRLRQLSPHWHFLILTPDWGEAYERVVAARAPELRPYLLVRNAVRESMPAFLNAADLAISLITPAASKIASSPTKLAEYWACGLPAISNGGVGDVEKLTLELQAGLILGDLARPRLDSKALESLLQLSRPELRQRAQQCLSLEVAEQRYRAVYASLQDTAK